MTVDDLARALDLEPPAAHMKRYLAAKRAKGPDLTRPRAIDPDDHYRGAGRTTTMLLEAVYRAIGGARVLVVGGTEYEGERLDGLLRAWCDILDRNDLIETQALRAVGRLAFEHSMRRGVPDGQDVLFDHYQRPHELAFLDGGGE